MKNKKKLLVAVAAMGLLAVGTAGVGTAAWYSASTASKVENGEYLGDLTIAAGAESLGTVKFNISANGSPATSLVYTNRTGRSYQVAANGSYSEVKASDTGSTLGAGYKQASTTWDVTITNAAGDAAPSVDALKSVAGTYTIRVSAGGSAKLSLSQTTTLGNKETATPAVNFANPATGGSTASGALGATANVQVNVMQIVIASDGSVKYKTDATAGTPFSSSGTSWDYANLTTPVQSAVTYYGLEVLNPGAEVTPAVADDSGLTPDVSEIS